MLLVISFVGAAIWVVNTETAAIYYTTQEGWPAALVGLVCAVGQCGMYALLYLGGDRVFMASKRLANKAQAMRARYGEKLGRRFLWLLAVGATIGVPPTLVLAPMASGFGVSLTRLLPVAFVCRTVRFSVIAASGGAIFTWLRGG